VPPACSKSLLPSEHSLLILYPRYLFDNYFEDQFSIAYDLYLEVLHRVSLRVKAELGQTSENWQLLNACPACMYEVEDEPPLPFSFMCEMDGNNSPKHTSSLIHGVADRPDS
jgi:hypothetical protein